MAAMAASLRPARPGAGAMTAAGLLAAACIVAGAMSMIDGYGNALFYRPCKPSQRLVMTPIFAARRNLADINQVGIFAILLSFFPIQVVYLTLGAVLLGLAIVSTRIHARLQGARGASRRSGRWWAHVGSNHGPPRCER